MSLDDETTIGLKDRWRSGAPLAGLFTRLRDELVYEGLALAGADIIMIDAEHGSFDNPTLSRCIFAARACGLTVLVRMPDDSLPGIQHALGAGAAGVVVPHVANAARFADVAEFVHDLAIQRAYAGATRASRFRRAAWAEFAERQRRHIVLVAQIDEPQGVASAPDILSVPGLDGVFLGGIGLSLAMRSTKEEADAAVESVCRLAVERNLPLGLSLPDERDAAFWWAHGVRLFLVDSDQSILIKGAETRLSQYRKSIPS